MKWPLFENKIGKALSAHRSEVDVDALWSAIEPEVDRINASRKKKRRGIIWFLFAGLVVAGSGAGFLFFNNGIEENMALERTTTEQVVSELQPAVAETPSTISSSLPATTPSEISENETIETTEKPAQLPSTKSEAIASQSPRPENLSKAPAQHNLVVSQSISSTTKMEQPTPIEERERSIPTESVDAREASYVPQLLGALPTPFLVYEKMERPTLPVNKGEMATATAQVPEPIDVLEKRHPASKKAFRFSAGARAGVGYADRRLASMNDSIGGDYLKEREATEKILETVQAGLLLSARHRSGFEASVGFQFARSTELFELKNTIENNDSIPGIKYYAVNPNNDTIPVFGMVPHLVTVETHKKYYNRYTLLDIPVLVGYHFKNGNWTLGGEAGVFANLSLKTSGRFLAENGTDVDIDPLFKSKVGLSYYAGFSAALQANDQLEFSLSPFVRHFPKNFMLSNNTLSQKYTVFGINAGARYWF